LFHNWTVETDAATNYSAANPLDFLMESNLTLTANFITNLNLARAGTYNGLFATTTAGAQTAGMLGNLALAKTGAYSGKLWFAGTNYIVRGAFDSLGATTNQISTLLGTLTLVMNLSANQPEITGSVTGTNGGPWTAALSAELAGSGLGSARYTLLLPPGTDTPPGDGYLLVNNHEGSAAITGALADGAPISQSVAESASGAFPVYAAPYTNGGLLLGWLGRTNGAPEGDLTWIKPPSAGGLFPAGFTNLVSVQSSVWTNPPADTPAVHITNGALSVAGGNLALVFSVKITGGNTVEKLGNTPTNSLAGRITPSTGYLTIAFGNGNGTNTTPAAGAVLQNQAIAGGFFLTSTNPGTISLQAQ
jgi:hypothetical protein